jgi:plasmid rolling circle replication initiator protein Rep
MLEQNPNCEAPSSQQPRNAADRLRLVDYSEKDRAWDLHRSQAQSVEGAYLAAGTEFESLASRMRFCSGILGFSWDTDSDTGESSLKLKNARFCRVRHCPVCQWRRMLMWKARFYSALPIIVQTYPRARWLFLTLTVRNCPIHDLGSTLSAMNSGWDRLRLRNEFKTAMGWIRTTEVTRSGDGSAHPHFHALLMVAPSYFGKSYVTQNRWAELWQETARLDYFPIVHVQAVKNKIGAANDDPASFLRGAVLETLKYAVKPADMIADEAWFLELTRQVHHRRFVAAGGALKDVLKVEKESNEDLALLGEKNAEKSPVLFFDWKRPERHYMRNRNRDTK